MARKIKWLTEKYIKSQAISRKKALLCSRLHWWQLKTAGPKELKRAYSAGFVSIHTDHCALCKRYYLINCDTGCPLQCLDLWGKTSDAFYNWRRNPTRTNWQAWKKASMALYEKIDRVIRRLYPKEESLE